MLAQESKKVYDIPREIGQKQSKTDAKASKR